MNSADRFTVLIAGMGLLFSMLCVGLGLIVRITIKWTRTEDKVGEIAKTTDKTFNEIAIQMREDRRATNERLTYLERSVWPVQNRRRNPT